LIQCDQHVGDRLIRPPPGNREQLPDPSAATASTRASNAEANSWAATAPGDQLVFDRLETEPGQETISRLGSGR
jgi:hypothetical protein